MSETEISSTGLGAHGGARADGLSAQLGVKGTGLKRTVEGQRASQDNACIFGSPPAQWVLTAGCVHERT